MTIASAESMTGTDVAAAGDAELQAEVDLKGIPHATGSAARRDTAHSERLRHLLAGLPGGGLLGLRVHAVDWLTEVAAINAAILAVAFVRYGGEIPPRYRVHTGLIALALVTVAYTVFGLLFRTYRIVWRFASVRDMAVLALTLLCTFVTVGLIELGPMAGSRPIPLSVLALGGAVAYLVMAHLKLVERTRQAMGRNRGRKPLIIFGAGTGGIALVRQLAYERGGYRPVAFLDDDLRKVGRDIAGLPVFGTRVDLGRAVKRYGADAVAIAIPSAQSKTIREITHRALDVDARALALPSITELMAGTELSLRDVGIEDLFGRSEVTVDAEEIRAAFTGRRVLITGAAGSIGSELARQVALLRPSHIDLLDNNESGLADLRDQLAVHDVPLDIAVASVTDEQGIAAAFASMRPEVVIHAAALKHVDIVESQPREAVAVNVRGTWICAKAAESVKAQRFIFISTDKAVDPVGVLGATKRIGELMMASLSDSATIFAAVRFGNVLGSRGSVLPKFERQISGGGPITVTHPDVRRFFMSTTEAVRLVLQSAAFAQPGHTYVLDMGEEMSIVAFAQRLAGLRGVRVPRDVDLVFTGLRPGERMTEKLIGDHESKEATSHPKVIDVAMDLVPTSHRWDEVIAELTDAEGSGDPPALRGRLVELAGGECVSGYAHSRGPGKPIRGQGAMTATTDGETDSAQTHHAVKRPYELAPPDQMDSTGRQLPTAPRGRLRGPRLPWQRAHPEVSATAGLWALLGWRADVVKVAPGLWVGSVSGRRQARRVVAKGVNCVVDLRPESFAPLSWPDGIIFTRIPLAGDRVPTTDELLEAATFITTLVRLGHEVLLHCESGLGLAPMVACAALILQSWSLAGARLRLTECCPSVTLREDQLAMLAEFETRRVESVGHASREVIGQHVDNSTRQIVAPKRQRVGRLTQLLAEDGSGQGVEGIRPRAATAPAQPRRERPGGSNHRAKAGSPQTTVVARAAPVDQALADQHSHHAVAEHAQRAHLDVHELQRASGKEGEAARPATLPAVPGRRAGSRGV